MPEWSPGSLGSNSTLSRSTARWSTACSMRREAYPWILPHYYSEFSKNAIMRANWNTSRFCRNRKGSFSEPLHVDLLHHARRRWKNSLSDCRLQTIESQICRRRRIDDLPSHKIPAAYADFVRTGFPREIEAILYHNAVDLVTSLDIAMRLAG